MAAAIVVTSVAWYASTHLPRREPAPTSIVVLRLEDDTGAADDHWLANGVPSMLIAFILPSKCCVDFFGVVVVISERRVDLREGERNGEDVEHFLWSDPVALHATISITLMRVSSI